jgi:hypothetical protein
MERQKEAGQQRPAPVAAGQTAQLGSSGAKDDRGEDERRERQPVGGDDQRRYTVVQRRPDQDRCGRNGEDAGDQHDKQVDLRGFLHGSRSIWTPIDRLSLDNGFDQGYNLCRSLSRDNFSIKLSQELLLRRF